MQLVINVLDFDHDIVLDLDNLPTDHLVIEGNRLTVWGGGSILARGRLELDHNIPVWRIFRGARGREVGFAREINVGI